LTRIEAEAVAAEEEARIAQEELTRIEAEAVAAEEVERINKE